MGDFIFYKNGFGDVILAGKNVMSRKGKENQDAYILEEKKSD